MRRILVVCDPSQSGRAALRHARALLDDGDAHITAIAVAPYERMTLGCATCRQNAIMWNTAMGQVAQETLAEAAHRLGHVSDVTFHVVQGTRQRAIIEAAERAEAEVIVIGRSRRGAILRSLVGDVAETLRSRGAWDVVEVPPPARGSAPERQIGRGWSRRRPAAASRGERS